MERTESAVRQQIAAMGMAVYEVGLYKPERSGQDGAVMIPRTWDVDTLLRSVAWLRLQNSQGRNIYIRPKGEHNLSMVDDLTKDGVARMKDEGFQPAAVVETSPGNFQAWMRHPRVLPRDVSTAAARELASRFGGDLGAADWRHFGRLAGFTNRKSRHLMPSGLYLFVKLLEASGRPYREGERFVDAVEAKMEKERRQAEIQRATPGGGTATKTIETFRANPVYAGDATRQDLAYAIYALAHGASADQVSQSIASRDLQHKGSEKRQRQYVERTVKKAEAILGDHALSR
ncbi:MAG: RepB family DNA primase [Bryobacteraceae bacterium]